MALFRPKAWSVFTLRLVTMTQVKTRPTSVIDKAHLKKFQIKSVLFITNQQTKLLLGTIDNKAIRIFIC